MISSKKVFLLGVIILAVVLGFYWYNQRSKGIIAPKTERSTWEAEKPSKKAPSPTPTIVPRRVEDLEKELGDELEGIASDLKDLEEFEKDEDLSNLDTFLSEFAQ